MKIEVIKPLNSLSNMKITNLRIKVNRKKTNIPFVPRNLINSNNISDKKNPHCEAGTYSMGKILLAVTRRQYKLDDMYSNKHHTQPLINVNRNQKKLFETLENNRFIDSLLVSVEDKSNGKKKLLNLIVSFNRQYPKTVFTQDFAAKVTGLSRPYVNACLKELHNLGFIEKIQLGWAICDKKPNGIYKSKPCQYKLGSRLRLILKLINTQSSTPLEHLKRLGSSIYAAYRYIFKNLTHITSLFYKYKRRGSNSKYKTYDFVEDSSKISKALSFSKKEKNIHASTASILSGTEARDKCLEWMPSKLSPKKEVDNLFLEDSPQDVTAFYEEYDSPELIRWTKQIKWENKEKTIIKKRVRKKLLDTQEMLRNRHQIRYEPMRRPQFKRTAAQQAVADKFKVILGV